MQVQLMMDVSAKLGASKMMALLMHAEAAYLRWGSDYLRKQDPEGLKLVFDAEMRRIYCRLDRYSNAAGYDATELLDELYDYAEKKYYVLCVQEEQCNWLEAEEALHI